MRDFDICEEFDCDSDYCFKETGKRCKKQGDENCIFKGEYEMLKGNKQVKP
jgi:hypothetical protein